MKVYLLSPHVDSPHSKVPPYCYTYNSLRITCFVIMMMQGKKGSSTIEQEDVRLWAKECDDKEDIPTISLGY